MGQYTFTSTYKRMLADTATPVSIFLRLRDTFPNSILLESSDYHSRENSMSFICCKAVAGILLQDHNKLECYFPDGTRTEKDLGETGSLVDEVSAFTDSFRSDSSIDLKFSHNGLFGYINYETVARFEDIKLKANGGLNTKAPLMQYHIYQYVIAIDHFKNELYLIENLYGDAESGIDKLEYLIMHKSFPEYKFNLLGEESSNIRDEEYVEVVEKMKQHIHRGDIFQVVPSRAFYHKFQGDEFNVYRSLRSVNPSPYLFYFDYGNFRLFGSSPEAQLTIADKQATIHPIAGTFKRTGNDVQDAELAEKLENDPKETAEHVMLVDLARNDLSRHCSEVKVEAFKEVQYYSHIIHLVSRVKGKLQDGTPSFRVVADTFPAGTLSGAPKHMAMQLINRYETTPRGFYSGAIGFLGFNGDFNHAIMIRSFSSSGNVLHYQAGAGVVAGSDAHSELAEVNNKIAALRKAMKLAEEI